MNTSQTEAKTRLFARVIGPFLAIATIVAIVRAPDLFARVSDVDSSPLWTWTAGAFTLLAGLVVIALHAYWRGAPAIIVSAMGWLTALKGLLLVAFPTAMMSVADTVGAAMLWWRGLYVGFALAGLYLTYVGWKPAASQSAPQPAGSRPDIPRAA